MADEWAVRDRAWGGDPAQASARPTVTEPPAPPQHPPSAPTAPLPMPPVAADRPEPPPVHVPFPAADPYLAWSPAALGRTGSLVPPRSTGVGVDTLPQPAPPADLPPPERPHDATEDRAPTAGGIVPQSEVVPSRRAPGEVVRSVAQPLTLAAAGPLMGTAIGALLISAGSSTRGIGVASIVIGLGVGVAAAVVIALRLHRRVDVPLEELGAAVASFAGAGGVPSLTPQPPGPVAALIEDFDAAAVATRRRIEHLVRKAEWGDQSRMIFEALELAEDESEAAAVVTDALALLDSSVGIELLLAEHENGRLHSVAHNPAALPPGCPVETTEACVALRRGQVILAESSESINACPRLRDRVMGPCSAVCVPVTVSGRPLGVLHAAGPDRDPPSPDLVDRLVAVASQAGNRLAALRVLASSREEAGTDGLTGLPNRRVLEGQLRQMLDAGVSFVMVLADLDKFKSMNDTYGHEAGDRALQLFARVLRENIRDHDLVARVGGEEFVVVYPEMSVLRSIEAIERLRQALAAELAAGPSRPFTSSFGVTHSSAGRSVEAILRVADAGLLRAKELGGDQVVYADEGLAAEVFGWSDPLLAGDGLSDR